ncbi:OsmC family peroxiredoxin [Olivibacter jilunii]|uniref:OsmC family peroxiredoxin n=1 Tax=Olivibacter jilunii TaxID=985016 RepID=UPI003F188233
MNAKVTAVWQGNFKDGIGSYRNGNSVLNPLNFKHGGSSNAMPATDPEELLGAAHASCFTMTLAYILADAGYTADKLETSVAITIKNHLVTRSDVSLAASVTNMDEDEFKKFAERAKSLCTVGNALNVETGLEISFETTQSRVG